jgi:hypothetical protein
MHIKSKVTNAIIEMRHDHYFHITLNTGPLNSGFIACVKN